MELESKHVMRPNAGNEITDEHILKQVREMAVSVADSGPWRDGQQTGLTSESEVGSSFLPVSYTWA
jgi:hypothetical protein